MQKEGAVGILHSHIRGVNIVSANFSHMAVVNAYHRLIILTILFSGRSRGGPQGAWPPLFWAKKRNEVFELRRCVK